MERNGYQLGWASKLNAKEYQCYEITILQQWHGCRLVAMM